MCIRDLNIAIPALIPRSVWLSSVNICIVLVSSLLSVSMEVVSAG